MKEENKENNNNIITKEETKIKKVDKLELNKRKKSSPDFTHTPNSRCGL